VDREHRQRPLNAHERAHPTVAVLELEAREPVGDGVGAGAAVALEVHPEKPQVGEGLRDVTRELAALEPVADPRQNLVDDEVSDRISDRALLVAEEAVDLEEVERFRCPSHGGSLA
jgi:hypothetical protein